MLLPGSGGVLHMSKGCTSTGVTSTTSSCSPEADAIVSAGAPDDRQVAPERHALGRAAEIVLDQPGHGERLALAQLDGRVELALGDLAGHLGPLTWVVAVLGVETLALNCRRMRLRSVI